MGERHASLSNSGFVPVHSLCFDLSVLYPGNTINRRAVCGRSACTVRRGGRPGIQPVFLTPIQPQNYWDDANTSVGDAGRPRYVQDHGADLYRRGLYTYWKRTFLHPALLVFDAPNRESCTVQRPISNTPLQALVLLNDVQFVEAARMFAQRIVQRGGTEFSERLEFAFRWALSRSPGPIDKQVLENLYRQQLGEYRQNPAAAKELIAVGESEVSGDIDAVELATWTAVARTILNLHETMTRN